MFHGSMVALVTPMLKNQEIDLAKFSDLIEWHIAQKTDALVILGSTGESATLNNSEKKQLIERAVSLAKGKLPIIVGTGRQSTRDTIEATEFALNAGADACLIAPPAYIKPTQHGMLEHFRAIARAVPIPILLYNVPGRTACDLLPETVVQLSHVANIVGIKEASADLTRIGKILNLTHGKFDLISGDDPTAGDFMLLGGKGVITVMGNILPKRIHDLTQIAISGHKEKTWELQRELSPLNHLLYLESNPIPVKWALYEMGKIEAGIRLPLTPLSQQYRADLRKLLTQIGCIES